jgi:DNA-directed RNA polymerase subunit omega
MGSYSQSNSTKRMKKNSFDSTQIMYRSDELLKAASNRYRITVAVAKRAKERRIEDFENDNLEEVIKPVMRAVVEMSDELTQPEIISSDG